MDHNLVNQIADLSWQCALESLCSPMDNNVLYQIYHEIIMKRLVDSDETNRLVSYCLSDKLNRACLEKWMSINLKKCNSSKNSNESKRYREMGNEKFKNGDDRRSIELYSKSVCAAPFESEEFPVALANRSAALFRLQLFKECLQDVDLALESGYPRHLKYKLLLRKGKLLLISKKCRQALEVFKEAEKCWPVNDKKNSVMYKELMDSKKIASENIHLMNLPPDDEREVPLPGVRMGESSSLRNMSAALDLKETGHKGRHIVANTDINKGDILFVEKPYAFVVLPIHYDTNGHNFCHNCCTDVFAPIPCQSCVTAMYCSEKCCKAAWEKFHKWECGGLELFYLVGIAHLGLRVTLVSNSEERGEKYEIIKSLVSHIHEMDRRDLYQYALTASLLSLFLKHKGYFSDNKYEMANIGGQILLHICQLTCNGHAITKFVKQTSLYEGLECSAGERAATAIYPSASMMNHSCEPNIINSFYNEHLVVRALKSIPKGGEVFNCYGPHYLRMNAKDRKKSLKEQYFFDCECPHCLDGSKFELLAKFTALLCVQCSGPLVPTNNKFGVCLECKNKSHITKLSAKLSKADNLYDQGAASLEAGNAADAISTLLKCLPLLESSVYKYNKRLRECKDVLSKSFSLINNFKESRKYLEECIPVVEKQFGDSSIEVGNEYIKLMTVYFNEAEQCQNKKLKKKLQNDCVKYGMIGQKILELYYGYWDEEFKDIAKKVEMLKALEEWESNSRK